MKKSLLALFLCLIMIISFTVAGCSVSPMRLVVGRVGSENITLYEVTIYANYLLMSQGVARKDLQPADISSLDANALDQAVTYKVICQKAAALGLYPLSAENQKKADDNFNAYMTNLQASGAAGTALQQAGLTEGDIRSFMTLFTVQELLMTEATKDVTVTDDEIKAEYDKLLSDQQSAYTATPTAYDSALTDGSTVVVYRPAGYRYIKHILIAMPQDIASQIQSATSSGDTATVATLREQGLAKIKDKANEALAKVQNGEDFDALIAQYGEDPGMKAEPSKTKGYQVGAKSSYVKEFLESAMSLSKPGDTSGLVATDYGYHIVKYVGDVPSGAVPLDEVKDGIRASVLATRQSDAFQKLVEQWKKEPTVKQNVNKIPGYAEGLAATASSAS